VDLHERETHAARDDRLGAILINGRFGLTLHLLNDFRRLVVHVEHTLFDDTNTRQLWAEVVGEYLSPFRGRCRADRQTREPIGELCRGVKRRRRRSDDGFVDELSSRCSAWVAEASDDEPIVAVSILPQETEQAPHTPFMFDLAFN